MSAPSRLAGTARPRCARVLRALPSLLLFTALAVGGSGCDQRGNPSPESGDRSRESRPEVVEFSRLRPEPLEDFVKFSGSLSAENSVVLRSEIDGIVASIEFEEGRPVEADQVMIRLRDAEQRARLAEALAAQRLAKDTNDRTMRLASRDVSAEARKAEAAALLDQARARVALAEVGLARTEIRAPFDGVAGARLVSPGDRVDDETPLVQVDQVERLQAAFALSEGIAPFARVGAPVQIQVLAYPEERFSGEVFFVSPTIDARSRRLILKAWIPNDDGRLKPGMFANVFFRIRARDDALLVPEMAVVYDRNGAYVWRVNGQNRVDKVPVRTGVRQEGRIEVLEGLASGDVVVSAGTNKLMAGDQVVDAAASATAQAKEGADSALPEDADTRDAT